MRIDIAEYIAAHWQKRCEHFEAKVSQLKAEMGKKKWQDEPACRKMNAELALENAMLRDKVKSSEGLRQQQFEMHQKKQMWLSERLEQTEVNLNMYRRLLEANREKDKQEKLDQKAGFPKID